MTAFAIACLKKDPALIELLVNSRANIKACDQQEGNTGILLLAISQAEEVIPTQEFSPAIFKVIYQLIYKICHYIYSPFPDLPKFESRPSLKGRGKQNDPVAHPVLDIQGMLRKYCKQVRPQTFRPPST